MADLGAGLMPPAPVGPVQDVIGRVRHDQRQAYEQASHFRDRQRDAIRCRSLYAVMLPVLATIPFFAPAFAVACVTVR